ncbi:hypothetical protein SAMN04487897_102363 [Paenibacillus sp. yr247]|nr:hypothetical protein SAMN04487897_102363 [Paenibacillus sp. yr247]
MKGGFAVKLAYINALPEEDQLHEFIQIYTEECITSGSLALVNWNNLNSNYVISVYDENTLVGIGCIAEEQSIHVRPTYEHREIKTMVNKLLQAESKFGLVHGQS